MSEPYKLTLRMRLEDWRERLRNWMEHRRKGCSGFTPECWYCGRYLGDEGDL